MNAQRTPPPTPTVLRGGLVYDGTGADPQSVDVWMRDGRIEALTPWGTREAPSDVEEIDVSGRWVTPGFVDLHTHYDAEIEVLPGLSESVRHGVTTVVLGSCGLSMVMGQPEALADMFCRVEGIPRDVVLPLLERTKTWDDPGSYLTHLDELSLGPNVAVMLGHSTIRAHVMGLGRSLEDGVTPSKDELGQMVHILEEALDEGYLGLSINTLPWDKMDGDAYRSRPTPSVYAKWSEYRAFMKVLRRRDAVFQGVPDVSAKLNAVHFFFGSLGWFRRSLRTMIITLLDARAERVSFRLVGFVAWLVNLVGGRFRLQSLPHAFDIWSDGLEVPVIEEFSAGTQALGLKDEEARSSLLRDPSYRRQFKREWRGWFAKAYHRDLDEATIVNAPDPALAGRSFAAVGKERGIDAVDAFLDLNADHGNALRWKSVIGNDRPRWVEWIASHPAVLIGFSDAGAHLRNMAFYNFGLRLLKRVRDAGLAGRPFMSVARAVHRLTAEIADFIGIDAGRLEAGRRADVVVIDPSALDDALERIEEAPMEGFADLSRLVRRNDAAVRGVWVGGHQAVEQGVPTDQLGHERLGRVLRRTTA
ncbi:MAG: amidohydrolase family protein [Myxococcota bacterium]